jgi:glycosyltransferase involved in cell wall biosynthesis
MKILQVHNFYQQRGGEATVVALEKALLEENGHVVITWYKDNAEMKDWSVPQKLKLLHSTTNAKNSAAELEVILRNEQPDICHVHNFFPLISPSIYAACQKFNVPVVQTLHNYRLICTNGTLFRDGEICEKCLGQNAFQSVRKKCYRNSAIQTWTVARMIEKNKKNGTWNNQVNTYICLSEFARQKFIEHGLPEEKLVVKPNFIPTTDTGDTIPTSNDPFFVFAGRLSEEKGTKLLAEIGKLSPYPILVYGDGPVAPELVGIKNVILKGKQSREVLMQQLKNAKALIFPSIWYEGMPMTILESFSVGTPVIAHDLGAMSTMIQPNENGLFSDSNPANWVSQMKKLAVDEQLQHQLNEGARSDYKQKYSKFANYQQLMKIYQKLLPTK